MPADLRPSGDRIDGAALPRRQPNVCYGWKTDLRSANLSAWDLETILDRDQALAQPRGGEVAGKANQSDPGPSLGRWPGNFNFTKAAFEIVIVAMGVLLALLVDEGRQSRKDRQLAKEAISAMRAELGDNRSRLLRKLGFLQNAYLAIESDPASAERLVAARQNQQVTLSKSAWVMTVETGALRLLSPDDRRRYAMVYTAQDTYYDILSQEMNYWTGLAIYDADGQSPENVRDRDRAIRLWKAWANRVALGICISAARTELALDPRLSGERLWAICRAYRVTQTPADLYRGFGVTTPPRGSFL